MTFALLLGFLAGITTIVYRGIYFGPWNQVINTMGACLAGAMVIYILFQILAGIGGFFLKLLFVALISLGIIFGGTKIWNTYNPDQPIHLPFTSHLIK